MEQIERLYREVIDNAITAHPRSLQKMIGPSEIGIECDRRILNKLAQVPESPRPPAWKPAIGTAVHDQLERWFDATNPTGNLALTDWVTEWEVTVGNVGGQPITGHADLFHVPSGTCIDHKVIGPKQLTKYRLHGPSQQYRVQAMLYAKGFTDGDEWGPCKRVAISFLPRDGELGQSYWWEAPYDQHVALGALNRLYSLWALLQIVGIEAALRTKPLCDDQWCDTCKSTRFHEQRANRTSIFDTGATTPPSSPSPAGQLPQTPAPLAPPTTLFQ